MKKRFYNWSIIIILLSFSSLFSQTPDTVWVDDDYDTYTAGWDTTKFAHIQDGINAVAPAGTVYVAAGTWKESCEPKSTPLR